MAILWWVTVPMGTVRGSGERVCPVCSSSAAPLKRLRGNGGVTMSMQHGAALSTQADSRDAVSKGAGLPSAFRRTASCTTDDCVDVGGLSACPRVRLWSSPSGQFDVEDHFLLAAEHGHLDDIPRFLVGGCSAVVVKAVYR